LPDEDQPPEEFYLNDDALVEHFEMVRARYKKKYGNDEEEVPDLEQNDLTRALRR
jgi:hypothetical protein